MCLCLCARLAYCCTILHRPMWIGVWRCIVSSLEQRRKSGVNIYLPAGAQNPECPGGRGGRTVRCVHFRHRTGTVRRTDRRTDPAPQSAVKHRNTPQYCTAQATYNTPLHPAALASVPYGIVLVRVRASYCVINRNAPYRTVQAPYAVPAYGRFMRHGKRQ